MLNIVLIAGIAVFALSSAYFYFVGRNRKGLNSAFLVSFLTLISYVLMWQGVMTVMTDAGEPAFPTRWLFYGASCTLLMVEIGQLKKVRGGGLAQMLYLTAIVMLTGFLAARDTTATRWIQFAIGSVAYILLVGQVLSVRDPAPKWVGSYVLFGWTVFPIVFALGPTGLSLIGAGVANLLYLLLDVYTKIIFNIQLGSKA